MNLNSKLESLLIASIFPTQWSLFVHERLGSNLLEFTV